MPNIVLDMIPAGTVANSEISSRSSQRFHSARGLANLWGFGLWELTSFGFWTVAPSRQPPWRCHGLRLTAW
jgi:hypothetical protein